MQSPVNKWNRWAALFRCAAISFMSAALSALIFTIFKVGDRNIMLAWFMAAGIVMFICLVAVKFCNLKLKDCERPGGQDG